MARTQGVAGLIACLLLAACGGSGRIVVGSKNFTEQVILGEIVAQHLERRLGARVDRKIAIVRDTSGDDFARARLRALERQAARMAPRKYGR